MFAHISMNWRGRPLTSHEAVIELIGATTTRQGLRIHAELDPGTYPTGVKVSDAELADVPLTRHAFHGAWNYKLTHAQNGAVVFGVSPKRRAWPPPATPSPCGHWC